MSYDLLTSFWPPKIVPIHICHPVHWILTLFFAKKFWDEPIHHKQLISSVWKLMPNPVVHIFWEGHKILQNLHPTFDYSTYSQKLGEDFAKFCGLLRILYGGSVKNWGKLVRAHNGPKFGIPLQNCWEKSKKLFDWALL